MVTRKVPSFLFLATVISGLSGPSQTLLSSLRDHPFSSAPYFLEFPTPFDPGALVCGGPSQQEAEAEAEAGAGVGSLSLMLNFSSQEWRDRTSRDLKPVDFQSGGLRCICFR